MDAAEQKAYLLSSLRAAHDNWQKLLDEVGPARMEQPGVEGDWSVKDVISHITQYQLYSLSRLQPALDGVTPGPSPVPAGDMDARNNAMYEQHRGESMATTLAEYERVYNGLLTALSELPASDIADANRFAWTNGHSLFDLTEGNSIEHYNEHVPELRKWLDQQEAAALG